MIRAPCFSAVTYNRAHSCGETTFSSLSRYFYLGGKLVTVLENNEIEVKAGSVRWAEAALKIAAYVLLLPFNLLLLPAYLILRHHYRFKPISAPIREPNENKPNPPPIVVLPVLQKVDLVAANTITVSKEDGGEEPLAVLGYTDKSMPSHLKTLIRVCQIDGWIDPDLQRIKERIQHLLTLEITEEERISLRHLMRLLVMHRTS